jgi:hypothetical protein
LLIEGSSIIESLVIGESVIVDLLGMVDLGLGIRAGGRGAQATHSGFADGGFNQQLKIPQSTTNQ